MATTATRKTATRRVRAERSASRTKQVVRLIKQSPDVDSLDIVKMYVPENKLKHMSADAQHELLKLAGGIASVVNAGQFDLRQAMR